MFRIILIFLIFALIHSITVTRWFKQFCRRTLGDTFMRVWYRALYTGVSTVTAAIALYCILGIPDKEIWTASPALYWLMRLVQLAGFVFGVRSFEYLDSGEFLGIKQVWRYLLHREVAGSIEGMTQKELVTDGVYGIVRHPLYLAGIIIFTFSPHVTVNGLAITILADLYFLFGVFIEERRFVKMFGDQYREYMKKVPRLVPKVRRGR